MGCTFHRCVYLTAAKEQPLMAAAVTARVAFGEPQGDDYMPHLSLLYADVDDAARHSAATAALSRLYGENADYGTLLLDPGFTASHISLWYTPAEDRSLASWRRVAEWPLGSGGGGGGGCRGNDTHTAPA